MPPMHDYWRSNGIPPSDFEEFFESLNAEQVRDRMFVHLSEVTMTP